MFNIFKSSPQTDQATTANPQTMPTNASPTTGEYTNEIRQPQHGDHLAGHPVQSAGHHEKPLTGGYANNIQNQPHETGHHLGLSHHDKPLTGHHDTPLTGNHNHTKDLVHHGHHGGEIHQGGIQGGGIHGAHHGKSIDVDNTKEIKRLGIGRGRPCTIRVSGDHHEFRLPTGPIELTVQIDMPRQRKLKHVKMLLYEGDHADHQGVGHDSATDKLRSHERVVCSQKFDADLFVAAHGGVHTPAQTHVNPLNDTHLDRDHETEMETVRATLSMPINDSDKEGAGMQKLTSSSDPPSTMLCHRVAVVAKFTMGSKVEVSTPVKLVTHSTLRP